jgi:hypothetical protein
MGRRNEFGNSWAEVVAKWCAGYAPPVTEEIAWPAMAAMEELWPEYLDQVLRDDIRSRLVMADVVDFGQTLQACSDLAGFEKVLTRLKKRDKGALAELRFAAGLIQAGYIPTLEPELNGNKLDASVTEGEERVFIEVISPELSQAMQNAEEGVSVLAGALTECTPGLITDVYLVADPDENVIRQVLQFVLSTPVLGANVPHEIAGVAFVKVQPFDPRIEFVRSSFIDRGKPAIGIVSTNKRGPHPSMAMVRLPIDDQRAARLMGAETHHFSRDETNVLAIDVSNIPGSIPDWIPLIERRFQPGLNRRFRAVILFTRVNQLHNANILRGYRVLRNQHAYRQPPEALLVAIANLDQGNADIVV